MEEKSRNENGGAGLRRFFSAVFAAQWFLRGELRETGNAVFRFPCDREP